MIVRLRQNFNVRYSTFDNENLDFTLNDHMFCCCCCCGCCYCTTVVSRV